VARKHGTTAATQLSTNVHLSQDNAKLQTENIKKRVNKLNTTQTDYGKTHEISRWIKPRGTPQEITNAGTATQIWGETKTTFRMGLVRPYPQGEI